MPQLWKSTKAAFGAFFLMISTNCSEKPPQKTLRLSLITTAPPAVDKQHLDLRLANVKPIDVY
jgi:hypothetical protein